MAARLILLQMVALIACHAAIAQDSFSLARPTLACRSLSEIRLWDNPAAASGDLQRTIAQGSCRNLDAGTAVTIAGQATLGADYECLQMTGEAECVWAGAISAPAAQR